MPNHRNPKNWVRCPNGHEKRVDDPSALFWACPTCGIRWPNPNPGAARYVKNRNRLAEPGGPTTKIQSSDPSALPLSKKGTTPKAVKQPDPMPESESETEPLYKRWWR